MTTIIKGSTKRGQGLIATFNRYEGYHITEVYDRPSIAKINAWNWCFEKFAKTEDRKDFHVCSFNTFNFTVGWLGKWGGENAIYLETRDNSYIVLLDK